MSPNDVTPLDVERSLPAVQPVEEEPVEAPAEEEPQEIQTQEGSICEVKKLVGRYTPEGEYKVVETTAPPPEAKDEGFVKSAIKTIRVFSSDHKYSHTEVEVRSPHIRTMMRETISYYPDMGLDGSTLYWNTPSRPLFHYLKEIKNYINEKDGETKDHCQLLYDMAHAEFEKDEQTFKSLIAQNKISWRLAWMLYRPGDIALATIEGVVRAIILKSVSEQRYSSGSFLCVTGLYTEMTENLGRAEVSLKIPAFSGEKNITSLNAFPLKYHSASAAVTEVLVKRGKQFLALAGIKHRQYQGTADSLLSPFKRISTEDHGGWADSYRHYTTIPVRGRIMIDAETFCSENTGNTPDRHSTVQPLGCPCENCKSMVRDDKPLRCRCRTCTSDDATCHRESRDDPKWKDHAFELSDEDLMLCSPFVFGFSFQAKRWCRFMVDSISDVQLNVNAFSDLEIPQSYKNLIHAMVKTQTSDSNDFDDIVAGKGKSLIFLLYGPPGVGKTLTAESIADKFDRPLWSLTSGELGTAVEQVEDALSKILEIAVNWKAIVLLDEADVFLTARNSADVNRNALVSVFLRLLEYYRGTLFLTSNKVSSFDVAFKSRIHIALRYPDLNAATRRSIWKTFLGRVAPEKIAMDLEKDLDVLEQQEINGRQIKSAVKTGISLAINAEEPLKLSHLMITIDTIKEFEQEFGE